MSSDGRLVVISGASGSGKTTICNRLLDAPGVVWSVSVTTRPPREGETDGDHYRFVDEETFSAMVEDGAFLEHALVHGHRYGTPRGPVEEMTARGRTVLLEIDVQGADLLRASGVQATYVFIAPPDTEELRRRLEGRGTDSDEVIERRLANARAESAHSDRYDCIIVNDDLESAVRETARAAGIAL